MLESLRRAVGIAIPQDQISPLRNEDLFNASLAATQRRVETVLASDEDLFSTEVEGLFDLFLDALPPGDRQYHNCKACRRFFDRFGNIVTISPEGETKSVLWDEAEWPEAYRDAIAKLRVAVERGEIAGLFLSAEPVWGTPEAGGWTHWAIRSTPSRIHGDKFLMAYQRAAERLEDYRTVRRALGEFTIGTLNTAVQLLEGDALYRTGKVLGPAKWLRDLKASCGRNQRVNTNLIWRAVAAAPAGFCHPRSSMIGTLLEDLGAGRAYEEVAARFKAKMHPLQYQRPQAAPTAGNLAEAERLVEKLGVARSLPRRYARLGEVIALWRPPTPSLPPSSKGVFAHIAAKGEVPANPLQVSSRTMTWSKFVSIILPHAESVAYEPPYGNGPYAAITTAEDADAPLIFQWENPFCFYTWHGGSPASQWGLRPGSRVKVAAITANPAHWTGEAPNHAETAFLLLEGAKDTKEPGGALFPETLRSELRPIRSTIEAYSKNAKMGGREGASACGVVVGKQGLQGRLLVRAGGVESSYIIDRWD